MGASLIALGALTRLGSQSHEAYAIILHPRIGKLRHRGVILRAQGWLWGPPSYSLHLHFILSLPVDHGYATWIWG